MITEVGWSEWKLSANHSENLRQLFLVFSVSLSFFKLILSCCCSFSSSTPLRPVRGLTGKSLFAYITHLTVIQLTSSFEII